MHSNLKFCNFFKQPCGKQIFFHQIYWRIILYFSFIFFIFPPSCLNNFFYFSLKTTMTFFINIFFSFPSTNYWLPEWAREREYIYEKQCSSKCQKKLFSLCNPQPHLKSQVLKLLALFFIFIHTCRDWIVLCHFILHITRQ